jgi:hypothetical protein
MEKMLKQKICDAEGIKKKVSFKYLLILMFFMLSANVNLYSSELWEIFTSNNTAPGYLRFDISNDGNFFLVDNNGDIVYQDSSLYGSNRSFYKLLKNGYWSTVTIDNKVRIYNDNFSLVGQISITPNLRIDAHDIESLSNGHYLLLCTEPRVIDMSKIVEGGQTNAEVSGVVLLEVDLNSNVHWIWNSFDYLNITDVTEDIDLTQNIIDFTHANAVDEDLDGNIIVSLRHFDEIIKIDKQTHRIMWRLGGSASKNNDFEFVNDTENNFFGFSHQHAIRILPNGHLLMFDNGNLKPVQFSRAVEYELDTVNKTCRLVWDYRESPDIFYGNMGNAQRLPNGNTLINWGQGRIMEVREDHSKAFDMRLEISMPIYRAFRYKIRMDAVLRNINSTGSYNFNEGHDSTGISLIISSLTGHGLSSIEKHYYQAKGHFNDTNFSRILPYRWVFSKYGINSVNGRVKINLSGLNGVIDPRKLTIYKRDAEGNGNFVAIGTEYDQTNNEIYADFYGLGEFVIGSNAFDAPYPYSPSNGSKAISKSGSMLEWLKVSGANSYLLQIAKDSTFKNLVKDTVTNKSGNYNLWDLDDFTVYYWRVATIGSKDTSDWSEIFSFRTKIGQTLLKNPLNKQGYVGLNCNLIWNKLNGATYYNIEIARDTNFTDVVFRNEQYADTNLIVNLDEYNRTYFWRVKGYNQEETGLWSQVRNFRSILPKPVLNLPHNLETNVDINYELKWNGGVNSLHYYLIVAKDSLFKDLFHVKENIADQKYEIHSLINDTEYFWKVRSVNEYGDTSIWSDVYSFSTKLADVKLISPIDNSEFKYVNIEMSWDTVKGVNEYLLQIGYDSGFLYLYKEFKINDSTKYLLKSLDKDIVLFWRVQARNGYKYGNWSETRRIIVREDNRKLIPPVLISPENNKKNVDRDGFLLWECADEKLIFDVQLSTDNNFKSLIIDTVNIRNEFLEYENLQFGKSYYWRVRCRDSVQVSEWSDVWAFQVADSTVNNDIVNLSYPKKGSKSISTEGELIWEYNNANGNIRKFYLEISKNPDFSQIVINRVLDTNRFFYEDLAYYTKYFWRVGVEDETENIKWSDIWFFETELETVISTIKNDSLLPCSGKISWESVKGATDYSFILSSDSLINSEGVLENKIIDIKNIIVNYYEYNLEANLKYFWQVRANGDGTHSRWSNVFSFRTDEGIDVKSHNDDSFIFEISPNPFKDEIFISKKIALKSKIEIKIFNIKGQEIAKYIIGPESNDIRIICNKLSSGIYNIFIQTEDGTKLYKMVKSE